MIHVSFRNTKTWEQVWEGNLPAVPRVGENIQYPHGAPYKVVAVHWFQESFYGTTHVVLSCKQNYAPWWKLW